MALYQASVLKKYLKQQDAEAIAKAYKKYTKYFLNPVMKFAPMKLKNQTSSQS